MKLLILLLVALSASACLQTINGQEMDCAFDPPPVVHCIPVWHSGQNWVPK